MEDEQNLLYLFFVIGGIGVKDDPIISIFWLVMTLFYGMVILLIELFKRRSR